ncbi:MAG: hypothetical protein FJX72_02320 [Armatimonadetes bacterium]|nr:hypothetical protein [Armatimonadota bacterium]
MHGLFRSFMAISVAALLCGQATGERGQGMADRWSARIAALHADPSLIRHYTFEQATDASKPIANAVSVDGALTYALTPVTGAPDEDFQIVQGRWPGKKALRLDRGVLSASAPELPGRAFTVEMWFRKRGPGALRGNDNATNGTLVSVGNGYWSGWRVTTSYPGDTFGFEIGRPAPAGSAGFFGCGSLPDGVWHHLAATWDGKEMRLYLNGLLADSMRYEGDLTPGEGLRIGYANAGWGSVKLDVDEVAVYGKAIGGAEALRMALFYADVSADQMARIEEAETARLRRDHARAAAQWESVASDAKAHADLAGLARLRLAELRRATGDVAGSSRLLAAIAGAPNVSERIRRTALSSLLAGGDAAPGVIPPEGLRRLAALPDLPPSHRLALRLAVARGLMASGKAAESRKEFAAIMDQAPDASERLRLRLEMAHALRAMRKHADARREYRTLADQADASPALRSTARLLAARTLIEQGSHASAAAAYRALLARPDALLSERMEADEALHEIDRLRAGKDARDPNRNRVTLPIMPKPVLELFVAPTGSDDEAGTAARPLRTLAGAVEAVRRLKAKGPLPTGGIAVTFLAGVYPVRAALQLGAADSGAPGAPIVYRAAAGADVRFVGGIRLPAPQPVTDANLLARMPQNVRGRALQVDLRAAGLPDPGRLTARGVGAGQEPMPELFWNGRPLTLARWPNEGWARTGAIVEERNASGGFTFAYSGDRMADWASEPEAWLFGYWGWLWADGGVRAGSFDAARGRIATAQGSSYAPRADMPWFIYNALCELDSPGEWYLDSKRGLLIVLPPSDATPEETRRDAVVEYSTLDEAFLKLDGASHVRFERLGFDLGRWNGIEVTGGANVLIAGCRIGRLRGSAVVIDGGRNHGVFGCDLHTLGRNGTSVKGGDRKTLTPSGHFVENCRMRDFSRLDRTYTPAVYAEGVAIRIAHNLIHDSPGHAMRIEGNDHLIEFNDVSRVVTETDDQGALDMWFNPTYRGVVIRYNAWKRVGDGSEDRMRAGIRLDDAICGVLIYGNVFERCADGLFGGVQIHGGKENEVVNNLFVDCRYGVSFSRWGADRWRQYTEGEAFVKATTDAVNIAAPPYNVRYPALAALSRSPDENVIARNLVINCGVFLTRDGGVQDLADNAVSANGPPAGAKDRLSGAAQAARNGFRPIPMAEIGRYRHPLAVGALKDDRR